MTLYKKNMKLNNWESIIETQDSILVPGNPPGFKQIVGNQAALDSISKFINIFKEFCILTLSKSFNFFEYSSKHKIKSDFK